MSQIIEEMKIEIQSLSEEECIIDVVGIDAAIGSLINFQRTHCVVS